MRHNIQWLSDYMVIKQSQRMLFDYSGSLVSSLIISRPMTIVGPQHTSVSLLQEEIGYGQIDERHGFSVARMGQEEKPGS